MTSSVEQYSLADEIDRKTFETVGWLTDSLIKGAITDGEFTIGIDAVFMAVAGLVGRDIVEIITAASQMRDSGRPHVCKLFRWHDKDVILKTDWMAGSAEVKITRRKDGGIVGSLVKHFDSPQEAAEYMSGLADKITKQGWIEL